MKFIKEGHDNSKYVDNLFSISNLAKADKDESTINCSVGSFCREDGQLLTYPIVFECEKQISDIQKASYAQGAEGNKEFNEAIVDFVMEGKVKNVRSLACAGGTGAVSLCLNMILKENDTILLPEIAWGNYNNMVKELNLRASYYDPYDFNDLLNKIDALEKVFVVINSPCQNPCGCSYTYDEWKSIFEKLNHLDKEAVILNDVAYLDYANEKDYKRYFELLDDLNDNVLYCMAYSCSKSFSYYGVRLGACLLVHNNVELLDQLVNQFARKNRVTWSSVNNSAMLNVTNILNHHRAEYLKQKDESVALLKQRADIFVKEAKECGLDLYPYKEGFFVTIKMKDNESRDLLHKKLMENHIYGIKVNKGIRIGICAISIAKTKGLASRIKSIINE